MARYAVTICSVVTMVSRYEPGMWCCRGQGQTICDSSLTVCGRSVAPNWTLLAVDMVPPLYVVVRQWVCWSQIIHMCPIICSSLFTTYIPTCKHWSELALLAAKAFTWLHLISVQISSTDVPQYKIVTISDWYISTLNMYSVTSLPVGWVLGFSSCLWPLNLKPNACTPSRKCRWAHWWVLLIVLSVWVNCVGLFNKNMLHTCVQVTFTRIECVWRGLGLQNRQI